MSWPRSRSKEHAEVEMLEDRHQQLARTMERLREKTSVHHSELIEIENRLYDLDFGRIPLSDMRVMPPEALRELEENPAAFKQYQNKRKEQMEKRKTFLRIEVEEIGLKLQQLDSELRQTEQKVSQHT